MPAIKIRIEEMQIVRDAATRVERRNNSRFVMDESKVQVTNDDQTSSNSEDEKGEETDGTLYCG